MSANAARDVADALRFIRAKAASDAPLAACKAVGDAAETAVKAALSLTSHPEGTRTPAAKGSPPSKVSGGLAGSIRTLVPAFLVTEGVARCAVGTTLVYGPVHEFGPVTITAKRYPQLGNPTVGFFGKSVVIPRRPYLAPTALAMGASGEITRVASGAWLAVMDF